MQAIRSGQLACIAAAMFSLAACAAGGAPASPGLPPLPKLDVAQQRGHDFAVRRCAGCHTVGTDDGGAAEGPPFRRLAVRYNPLSLERRFLQVSAHGVDRMPPVQMTRAEAEDLVAYIDTLSGN
jgi:mono/diheme cytochrome c family protein